jgi:hypothetical protein
MLNIWNQPSGYSFNTYSERQTQTIPLPLIPGADLTNLTFTVIAGRLPSGLRITYDNNLSTWTINGSPLEVATNTTSTFVIRAKNSVTQEISDRTFYMTIDGPDAPVWITEGQDPDIQIYDFDIAETYSKDMVVRRTIGTVSTLYQVSADTVTGILPPNSNYYQIFSEPMGQLPVGLVTTRVSLIVSAKRTSNLITVTTGAPHNFVFGNIVTIASNLPSINAVNVEVLQPVPLPGEEYENYLTRISTTITYNKLGANFASQSVTGTVTLIRDPLTFVLDNSLVDFQLEAIDSDLSSTDSLEYFIADGDGELPPGLSLDSAGRISGIIDPILALDITARTGFYDTNLYDAYAYDFGKRPNIGEEDYLNVVTPRKLNRNYEFIVTVSDGESISRRRFRIYVVGDDFLRSDNTIVQIGTGTFTADSTYLRAPIWQSARNLGLRRANNYITIILNTFDPNPNIGPVRYELASLNDDLSPSILPNGVFLDPITAEIFGFAPYQPAITKEYKFTINAIKYDKENITEVEVAIVVADDAPIGQNFLKILPLPEEDIGLIIGDVIRIGPSVYTMTEYISNTVTGGTMATLKLAENLLTNVLDGLIITKLYNQSVSEFSTQVAPKTFTISVLGEVDSVIQFNTDRNLGSIKPSFPSNFYVEATTTVPNAKLIYTLVSGTLPSGLTLKASGIIEGKINQFRTNSVSGFTLFDTGATTFDGDLLTIDRSYKFTVNAQDQFRYSSVNKEFVITISEGTQTLYSNIYTKPLPKQEKRELFYNFINDTTVFEPDRIYRLGDPSYGLQTELKMLIYPGIESKEMSNYISAISKNIKRKRYRIGNLKKAVAKTQGTNNIVYEVIYLEILDDYEIANKSASKKIKLSTDTNSPIQINQARRNPVDGKLGLYDTETGVVTYESLSVQGRLNGQASERFSPVSTPLTIDTANVNISGEDLEYVYPSSIKNIRANIAEVGLTENEFLPLWMTTPQDARTAATGFVKAVPLCYCKPGEGQYILENILNRNFDFNQLDFEIDRFIIDSDINDVQEKYLKFSDARYNI